MKLSEMKATARQSFVEKNNGTKVSIPTNVRNNFKHEKPTFEASTTFNKANRRSLATMKRNYKF
jgi:hypothetical protein